MMEEEEEEEEEEEKGDKEGLNRLSVGRRPTGSIDEIEHDKEARAHMYQ